MLSRQRVLGMLLLASALALILGAGFVVGHLDHHHHHHECAHSKLVPKLKERSDLYLKNDFFDTESAELTNDKEAVSSKTRGSSSRSLLTTPRPFEIHFEYQVDNLPSEKQAYLKEKLMPAASSILKNFISAKSPVTGKLLLARHCRSMWDVAPYLCYQVSDLGKCSGATHNASFFGAYKECSTHEASSCTTNPAGEGVEDKDIILYVTSTKTSTCGAMTIAYAGWCELDPYTKRPIAGAINFCPDMLSTDANSLGKLIDTTVHEVLHVLAFSDELYQHYLDESGQTRGYNNVINQDVYPSVTYKSVKTPKVLETARNHFGCNSLNQVALEQEGGSSTAYSHWEESHYRGEIMVGVQGGRGSLSNLTLSLLEDSGWYTVDYSHSQFNQYGYQDGCEFVSSTCNGFTTKFPHYSCTSAEKDISQCTSDYRAFGYCTESDLGNTCTSIKAYQNGHCTNSSFHSASRERFGETHGLGARCFEAPADEIVVREGNIKYKSTISGSGCFQTSCDDQGKLSVGIGGKFVECPAGQYVNYADIDSKYESGRIGPCPRSEDICAFFGCPNDCSGVGLCHNGKCHCYLGHSGVDCSQDDYGTSTPSTPATPSTPSTPSTPATPTTPTTPSTPSTPATPATPTTPPAPPTYTLKYRVLDGYLAGCKIYMNDVVSVTDGKGVGILEHQYEGANLVVTAPGPNNQSESCKDTFTNLGIPFQFTSFSNADMVTPLTTLAVTLTQKHGLSREAASERISNIASLPKTLDMFSYDPIVHASEDETGFLFTQKLTSTLNSFSEYYSKEQSLPKEEVATTTFEALAGLVAGANSTFNLTSETDLNTLLAATDSKVASNLGSSAAVASKAKSSARSIMVDALKTGNELYDTVADSDIEGTESLNKMFTLAVQASVFSQTKMVEQMNKLVAAQTAGDYSEINTYIGNVSWNNTALFEEIAVPNYGVHTEESSGDSGAKESVSSIVDALEDNLIYICIGAGAIFLIILFVVSQKLRKDRQIVKSYDDDPEG